jgi:hypothetical protein
VLGASAATLSAVIDLATAGVAPQDRDQAIGRLLFRFALEAVGAGNVESDRFRAVNEALLPILADRIASLRSTAATMVVEYRLRESLLNDMAYELHSYRARPGIISFRESKAKAVPPAKADAKQ